MTVLDFALQYASRGWAIIPLWWQEKGDCACKRPDCDSEAKHPLSKIVPSGVLEATTNQIIIKEWFRKFPKANIGIACGKSKLLVLDVDPRHGGSLDVLPERLPDTITVLTGGGGQHIYFSSNDQTLKNCSIAPGIDVRCNASYVVAPPSVHKSGNSYEFEVSSGLDVPLVVPPQWLLDLMKSHKEPIPVAPDETILEGQRNDILTHWAGIWRARGLEENDILLLLRGKNEHCVPPLTDKELETIAHSIARYPSGDKVVIDIESEHMTDLGNGKRLARLYGDKMHFIREWGWLCWNGVKWENNEGQAMRYAKDTVRSIYGEAERGDDESRKKLAKWAMNSESDGRIMAMLDLGRSELSIEKRPWDFDTHPLLVNCDNGVLDLNAMMFLPHSPHMCLTKKIGTAYDSKAECPTWMKFLYRIMDDNREMVEFIQRCIGYSLSGNIEEECLFFLYGTGFNGKSTFTDTLEYLLGDYACKAPATTLMIKKNEGVPNDIARLVGSRLITVQEIGEGHRLNENIIKDLTGGDTITARFLNKEFFEYRPTFKIWMYGNHKPGVRGTDRAIWRRIHLLPFKVTIPESERDPKLKGIGGKLHAELPGILTWAIEGYRTWRQGGLQVPSCVKKATETYRAEMDVIATFIDDKCVMDKGTHSRAGELYKKYGDWCMVNGETPVSSTMFGRRLVERGLDKYHDRGGWVYLGIGILEE